MKGIALFICILAASIAAALDSFDVHCANILVLQNKQVQADVGISESQRKQMNQFADAHRAKLEAYQKKLGGKAPDVKVLEGYLSELKGKVLSLMTPQQVKRLREINLQAVQLGAIMDKVVATKVGLSDQQYKQFRQTYISGKSSAESVMRAAIIPIDQKYEKLARPYKADPAKHKAELQKLTQDYMKEAGAARDSIKPRVDAITQQTEQKLLAIMTAKQKATWTALLGKRFVPSGKR